MLKKVFFASAMLMAALTVPVTDCKMTDNLVYDDLADGDLAQEVLQKVANKAAKKTVNSVPKILKPSELQKIEKKATQKAVTKATKLADDIKKSETKAEVKQE